MIAESPTSPRARDRITVNPISTDTIARLHAEAEATGRTVAADGAPATLAAWLAASSVRSPFVCKTRAARSV